MENPQRAHTDSYSLDDTRAGRVVQALGAAACVAIPDAVSGRWPIIAARAGVLAATATAAGVINAVEEKDEVEQELVDDSASPLTTWAIIGGIVAGLGGLAACENQIAKQLTKRGVRRPHTALGMTVGAMVYVASELEHLRQTRES